MFKSSPVIEFICRPEDKGVVAEPVSAGDILPAWFRRLPGIDQQQLSATNNGLTVKRCMPFLDALSAGWIIPLAADVRLEISEGGCNVTAGWELDREMVSNHASFQVAGNPFEPRPPMKFHNYWTVRTPKGWSCLFLPPVNRPHPVVQLFSGVVDTDEYPSPVNLPFVATAADGVYTFPKGMPLVQVVPFQRAPASREAIIRSESEGERESRERAHRAMQAGQGWYRTEVRSAR